MKRILIPKNLSSYIRKNMQIIAVSKTMRFLRFCCQKGIEFQHFHVCAFTSLGGELKRVFMKLLSIIIISF